MSSHVVTDRGFCIRCHRSQRACLCALIPRIQCNVRFIFLMHPKEMRDRKGTGTGRLTHLALSESRLLIGTDFDHHPEIQKLLDDPKSFPCLLFPSTNAFEVGSASGLTELGKAFQGKSLVVIVIDGSWACAKTLVRNNPRLASLPTVSFHSSRTSQFLFKRQPDSSCLSTLESVHELLTLLHQGGLADIDPPQGLGQLLLLFEALVDFQLRFGKSPR